MARVLDLPTEILLQVANILQQSEPHGFSDLSRSTLDWSDSQHCHHVTPDIRRLRAVCRRWHAVFDLLVSACISLCDFLNKPGNNFRLALRERCARPEHVRHLHLSWSKAAVRDIAFLVEPFPKLTTLEIAQLDSKDWHRLAASLSSLPGLRTLKLKFVIRIPRRSWQHIAKTPRSHQDALSRIKKLRLDDIYRDNLESILAWFPFVEHLVADASPYCINNVLLNQALSPCKDSLKVLHLHGGWTFTCPDLRCLEKLEFLGVTGWFDLDHLKELKLAPSVKEIAYTRDNSMDRYDHLYCECFDRNMTWWQYESEALQDMLTKRGTIAPGLQHFVIRILKQPSCFEDSLVEECQEALHDSDVTLRLEGYESEVPIDLRILKFFTISKTKLAKSRALRRCEKMLERFERRAR